MAGVPGATLEGWAVAIPGTAWDHTYAVSSCGLRWGCWGRSAGGAIVASGIGDSSIADCLSQPGGLAGINYGVTGVCHQIANRILHPAGAITVALCRGYATSHFAFGPYGRGIWSGRAACYSTGTGTGTSNPQLPFAQSDAMTRKGDYDAAVSRSLEAAPDDQDAARGRELRALVQFALGEPLDPATFQRLAAIQSSLRVAQGVLVQRLESGSIPPEAYLAALNEHLRRTMDQCLALLGPRRFDAIFGEAGKTPEQLVDRETFLSQDRGLEVH